MSHKRREKSIEKIELRFAALRAEATAGRSGVSGQSRPGHTRPALQGLPSL